MAANVPEGEGPDPVQRLVEEGGILQILNFARNDWGQVKSLIDGVAEREGCQLGWYSWRLEVSPAPTPSIMLPNLAAEVNL